MTLNDRDIERLAGRLGERAGAGLDLDRVTRNVTGRLRAARRPWWAAPSALRAAAVVLFLAGAGLFGLWSTRTTGTSDPVSLTAPAALQALSENELEEVLDSLAVEGPTHTLASAGLADLDEQQLEELLRLLEG